MLNHLNINFINILSRGCIFNHTRNPIPILKNTHLTKPKFNIISHYSTRSKMDINNYDPEQVQLMKEECILINEEDNVIGHESKKFCHLAKNINNGALHRAFSVFLFNKDNKLLLQCRSSEKITFPNLWTNTCCSHPLYTSLEMETENLIGVKRAAIRKLHHELGIKDPNVNTDNLKFITRIHYKALSDDVWGEHEIDYIFFIKADPELDVNPNEVCGIRYVSKEELKVDISKGIKITPWFKLICNTFIYDWWDKLDNLESLSDYNKIHRL